MVKRKYTIKNKMRGGAALANSAQNNKLLNTYVLSYDGLVTGSNELRQYNNDNVSQQYSTYSGGIISYADKYDNYQFGGKKNEPFFDGFLVHMAFLDPTKYNDVGLDEMRYYEIKYHDSVEGNTGYESKLRTSPILPTNFISTIPNYLNGRHVFIMSPFTQSTIEYVEHIFNEHPVTTEDPLIFHIQGECIKGPDGNPRYNTNDIDTGMTPKARGGMFGEAFNLYSGGIKAQLFRQIMKTANLYAVKPRCRDREEVEGATKGLPTRTFSNIIPAYYRKVNDDILNICSNNSYNTNCLRRLNVIKVFQDFTDKDNLASLGLMAPYIRNGTSLNISGFRLYNSTTTFRNYSFFNAEAAKKIGNEAQKKFAEDGNWYHPLTSGFRPRQTLDGKIEYEKPADYRGFQYGNKDFLKGETISFYNSSSQGFIKILSSVVGPEKYVANTNPQNSIADGLEISSESLRAPFNMCLYFFAPETYMDVGVGDNNGDILKGLKQVVNLKEITPKNQKKKRQKKRKKK